MIIGLARHRPQPRGTLSASCCRHVGNRAAACLRRAGRPRLLRRDRAPRQGRTSGRCRRNDRDRRGRENPCRCPAASRPLDRGRDCGGRAANPGACGSDPVGRPARPPSLSSELWYALSALTVRMPPTRRTKGERAAMAQALISMLAARMGIDPPPLDAARRPSNRAGGLAGNLRQMRTVLCAVLAAHRGDQPVSRVESRRSCSACRLAAARPATRRNASSPAVRPGARRGGLFAFGAGAIGLRAAVDRTAGNLSAAARLLGLTRAQLAYRVGARDGS